MDTRGACAWIILKVRVDKTRHRVIAVNPFALLNLAPDTLSSTAVVVLVSAQGVDQSIEVRSIGRIDREVPWLLETATH